MIPNQSGAAGAGIAVVTSMAFGPFAAAAEYTIDAAQRSLLFWDVMRQRGNQYREHMAQMPCVLHYKGEVVIDGRTLEGPSTIFSPVSCRRMGSSSIPSGGLVVIDPRAGHGPGIGGFKSDSEIGVAFEAGHPCYFIGFLPEPMPGQTIEDIIRLRPSFWKESSPCIPKPMASHA